MHRKLKHSRIIGLISLALLLGFNGCGKKGSGTETAQKPALVANPVKESSLTTIRLTEEAESRLGIETREAEIRDIPKTLTLGGEVIAPPGLEAIVTAPISGMVSRTAGGQFPVAGSIVQMNQEVMRLILVPPEMDIISAEEDARVKQMEYDVALAELNRAEKLLQNKAISDKVFESTKALFARADASLKAARGRLNIYEGKDPGFGSGDLSTFTIRSPVSGVIQNIGVTPGQIIAVSAILFEVSPVNRFWIRVPVYSGDLPAVDAGKQAVVSIMGEGAGSVLLQADPIHGPLVSTASSASSYLYYEIDNRRGGLRSGQKVSVTLTLKSKGFQMTVPYSSVIYDIQGGTWVYVRSESFVYTRTRVELSHVSDTLAVLNRGVSAGDEIVLAGAAELFGTEFGVGK